MLRHYTKLLLTIFLLQIVTPLYSQEENAPQVLDSSFVVADFLNLSKGNRWRATAEVASGFTSVSGVPDPIRPLAALPGVSQGMEGTHSFFVRGSNLSGNRIELSSVPIYCPTHLLGLLSSFDMDMVSSTTFTSGAFPSSSGNATASLTSVELIRGNLPSKTDNFSISPYISGVHIAIPGRTSKLNCHVSARISPFPELANLALSQISQRGRHGLLSTSGFSYDLLSAIDWTGKSISADVMFFSTMDKLKYLTNRRQSKMNSSEHVIKASISHKLGNTGNIRAQSYINSFSSEDIQSYGILSDSGGQLAPYIENKLQNGGYNFETSTKVIVDGLLCPGIKYESGTEILYRKYELVTKYLSVSKEKEPVDKSSCTSATDVSAFGDISGAFADMVNFTLGVRPTAHLSDGKQNFNCDVHAMTNVNMGRSMGIEVCYDRAVQYHHLLEGLPVGWGQDLYIASNAAFPEEVMNQIYAGVFFSKVNKSRSFFIDASLGAYYKTMHNLVSYKSAENLFGTSSISWENDVTVGEGTSKGIEVSMTVKFGRIDLRTAYTLSKTDRTYPDLNYGKPFPFRFDRRHIANVMLDFLTVSKGDANTQHLIISGNYSSGNYMTEPLSEYSGLDFPMWKALYQRWKEYPSVDDNYFLTRLEMNSINNLRVPSYFRIDVAYSFKFDKNELSLSVYNLLNRHNPYQIFWENGKWKKLSLFSIMPSIRWKYIF